MFRVSRASGNALIAGGRCWRGKGQLSTDTLSIRRSRQACDWYGQGGVKTTYFSIRGQSSNVKVLRQG